MDRETIPTFSVMPYLWKFPVIFSRDKAFSSSGEKSSNMRLDGASDGSRQRINTVHLNNFIIHLFKKYSLKIQAQNAECTAPWWLHEVIHGCRK